MGSGSSKKAKTVRVREEGINTERIKTEPSRAITMPKPVQKTNTVILISNL